MSPARLFGAPTFATVLQWLGLVFAGIVAALSNLPAVYGALLAFMVMDVISGALRGGVQGKLSGQVAYTGILRKAGELLIVGGAWVMQQILPGVSSVPLPEALAAFYIYSEGLSVLENLAVIGVPIPEFLRKALSALSPEKNIPPTNEAMVAGLKRDG